MILVIATIVLGPERMAQAGRTLGRLYAQYRIRWQRDVDEMTRELRRELAMLQQEVDDIRQAAESEIKTAQAALEGAVEVVDSEIKGAQAAVEGSVEAEDSQATETGVALNDAEKDVERIEDEADAVADAEKDAATAAQFKKTQQQLEGEKRRIDQEAQVSGDLTLQKAKLQEQQKKIDDSFALAMKGLDADAQHLMTDIKGIWDMHINNQMAN